MRNRFINFRSGAMLLGLLVLAGPAAAQPRDSGALFPGRVLAAHNSARAAAGVAPLHWDNELGTQAAKYALHLAISGIFTHSPAPTRGHAGENLWMGSKSAFSVESMVGSWVSERSHFRPGIFPAVSRTARWRDVGHYTQIIWPGTKRVGCALAANANDEYLVCRYWPAGNVHGVPIQWASSRHNEFRRYARR